MFLLQISDFGMSRDLLDKDYYISRGGMIPVKWTAPEVLIHKCSYTMNAYHIVITSHRPYTTRSTPLPVMCGALGVSYTRFGVLDTNHLKATIILRYVNDRVSSRYIRTIDAANTIVLCYMKVCTFLIIIR